MRRVLATWLVMSALPLAARAERDYAIDNSDWNGLSSLAAIAAGRGLTVEARDQISWSELGPSDVLFIVYPTSRVEPSHLAAFLRAGGRALIADDFGRADEALARLGILRRAAPRLPAARVHDGNPNLPLATAPGDHPLSRGVSALTTNHPTAFTVSRGPDVVFSYGGEGAVVVAGQLGPGHGLFVALSDPSVLINDMLAFDGNLTFALNLLDFLAPARPGRIVLVTHDARLAGEPAPWLAPDEQRTGRGPNEVLAELSLFLDELNDYLAPREVLHLLGAGLGGLALLLGLLLPGRHRRDPDAGFANPGGETARRGHLLTMLDLYEDERRDRNYAAPAIVLRENAEAEMRARVEAAGPDRPLAERALALLRKLPERALTPVAEPHVSRRDFVDAHAAVAAARQARRPAPEAI